MENFVNNHIAKEKNTVPSPFLAERIIQKINEISEQETKKSEITVWQSLTVAASFAAVILLGIAIGDSYRTESSNESALIVNDKYIEHLYIFKDNTNTNE